MLINILKIIILSFILILIIHNIYLFFQKTLTIPKIKDLVIKPNEQYKEIYNTINNSNPISNNANPISINPTSNSINPTSNSNNESLIMNNISSEEEINMKKELKKFFNTLEPNSNSFPNY